MSRRIQKEREEMKLEEMVKSLIKEAPEMDIRSWLDRQVQDQKRRPPYDFYNEADIEVARTVLKGELYLKYRQKMGGDLARSFRELSLDADKKDRTGVAYFMALSEMEVNKQEQGITAAQKVIEDITQSVTLPDDEKLWAVKEGRTVRIYAENHGVITIVSELTNGEAQEDQGNSKGDSYGEAVNTKDQTA